MSEIASRGQIRASFWRWAAITVPALLILGFLSGRSVPAGSENAWYVALDKPALNPPGWVFPVVWSILYILQGLALAIVLNARGARERGPAVLLFAFGFACSLGWTPLFFGAHRITLAALLIAIMVVNGILTAFVFARVRRLAAWLLVPYLVWISFAGVLCWSVGQLNPDAESLADMAPTSQIS